MWPLKSLVSEKQALFWGFHTHVSCCQGHMQENINLSTKPRHVTPQIDHLGKTGPVLRVSTHIYGISKKIDGKVFIFRVNLGMWPLKSIVSEKQALFLRVLTHIYGVSQEIDVKTFIFSVNLDMWPLKLIISEKQTLFWGFQHTFMGFLRR